MGKATACTCKPQAAQAQERHSSKGRSSMSSSAVACQRCKRCDSKAVASARSPERLPWGATASQSVPMVSNMIVELLTW